LPQEPNLPGVKEINWRLIELGLITMKDSPNGKRYGTRDANDRIIEVSASIYRSSPSVTPNSYG
jgi:Replication protein C N-terminal domain